VPEPWWVVPRVAPSGVAGRVGIERAAASIAIGFSARTHRVSVSRDSHPP